jgi:hypothetical protein
LAGQVAPFSDPVERLFRRLVANLSALDPSAVHRPVAVGEIAQRLVPYRTHRGILGLDTNEDYEMAVLRLLAGDGGFAQVFPEDVAAALTREAASVNPDPGIFHQFTDATFLLDADRVAGLTGVAPAYPDDELETAPEAISLARAAETDGEPDNDEAAEPLPFSMDDEESDSIAVTAQPRAITVHAACSYCGGNLPVGRTVLFCPHCGQNIGVVHCPTCGSELDVGWTFCITCGQKVTGIG